MQQCGGWANPIVRENSLPGSPASEWDVNGAGGGEVEGFAHRASYLPSDDVRLKIRLSASAATEASTLRVDVYRLGYYGGLGARKLGEARVIDAAAAAAQPACATPEPQALLVDCGNWADVASFTLPPNVTSGLYFARFVLPQPNPLQWRADGSRHIFDPHHACAGRDRSLPPEDSLPHAYGGAGHNRLRKVFALREPRAAHAWFVVREAEQEENSGSGEPENSGDMDGGACPSGGHGGAGGGRRAAWRAALRALGLGGAGKIGRERRRLLFQTSDTAWHAYNGYGGYTTYGSFDYPFEHAPGRAAMNLSSPGHDLVRAHKRSYNTPLVTRDYRAVNAPLSNEYPAIRFLEAMGYDLHYASGADMSSPPRASRLLRRSSAFASVGHDEYWSWEQRRAVETARDAWGVHLNFWSANEAYWAVRFEPSALAQPGGGKAGGAQAGGGQVGERLGKAGAMGGGAVAGKEVEDEEPGRTMVCYKETQDVNKLDPMPGSWTGTFRDARPINPRGAAPESALSGTLFVANAWRADALVVDPHAYGKHRLWAGTSVAAAANTGGGKAPERMVLCNGMPILGHEWNEDVDNGHRPAALQVLSRTTVDNIAAIQDHGSIFDSSTATQAVVAHWKETKTETELETELALNSSSGAGAPRTQKENVFASRGSGGGGVSEGRVMTFSSGTIQWAWGLDAHHDVDNPHLANKYATRVSVDPRGPCLDVQQFTANVLAEQGLLPATPLSGIATHKPAPHRRPPRAGVTSAAWHTGGEGGSAAPASRPVGAKTVAGGTLVASGWAAARRGVVASVEVSWDGGGRWHPATLPRMDRQVRWSFLWGDQPWHVLHGAPPEPGAGLSVRVADDAGNVMVSPTEVAVEGL